jgi:hypothetical protein
MADLGGTFDATGVAPAEPRDVIPAGKYNVQIINSEMRDTKNGAGKYLWLELEILDGQFARQHMFDRLNLINQNQTAVEIAQRALSSICHAVGKLQVSNSEQLHFLPLTASVKVKPAQGEYAASNEIGGYSAAGGGGTVRPAGVPTATQASRPGATVQTSAVAPAGGGGGVPPWRKKVAAGPA